MKTCVSHEAGYNAVGWKAPSRVDGVATTCGGNGGRKTPILKFFIFFLTADLKIKKHESYYDC